MGVENLMNGPTDPHGFGQRVPPVSIVGPATIGHVEEIHGEGGRPCPEFIPTRHELLLIARHWAKELLDLQREWEESHSTGSEEAHIQPYAINRLDQIAALIGDEPLDALFAELRGGSPPAGEEQPR